MIKKSVLFVAAMCLCGIIYAQNTTQRQRLEKHVYTLASDSLQGRKAGSPDAVRAANYLIREWKGMGLKPFFAESKNYRMPFEVYGDSGYYDLVAIIEGNDPKLKDEYIVIGGHYDHLGVRNGKVYNGADDNASGASCVTEVARQLLARQKELRRSVIICAFDAEEMGLHGSDALATRLSGMQMIGKVKLMMSVDMVGWLKAGGSLTLEGTGTLKNSQELTDPKLLGVDIPIRRKKFENSIFTATDTEPFAKKGVATLAVTTGIKSPYHKPEDDAELIDYEGLDKVTDYMAAFTLAAANREGELQSGKVAPKHLQKNVPFNVGLSVGYNSSWLRFPNAGFEGKSLIGGEAGLALQYNISTRLSVHADILYNYTRSIYPDPENAYENSYRLCQHAITAPVLLQLNLGDVSTAVYLNLGGYYGRNLSGTIRSTNKPMTDNAPTYKHVNADEWGIAWGFGLKLGYHWQLGFTALYQLNQLFDTGDGMQLSRDTRSSAKLTYYF